MGWILTTVFCVITFFIGWKVGLNDGKKVRDKYYEEVGLKKEK